MPGTGLIIFSLYVVWLVGCRQVFYHWGVPLSLRLTSQMGNSIAFVLCLIGTIRCLSRKSTHRLWSESHVLRVCLLGLMIPLLTVYGVLVRGNAWHRVGAEALSLSYLALYLLIGTDDRFWYAMHKHLTVLFYLTTIFVIIFYDIPMVPVLEEGQFLDLSGQDPIRHSNAIGTLLRPLLGTGVLLGMWGLVRPGRGKWRPFQILAPFIYFATEVGIFKFRSSGITVVLSLLSYLVLRPLLAKRVDLMRMLALLTVAAIAGGYFLTTDSSTLVRERLFGTTGQNRVSLFQSRLDELDAFMSDAGWEIFVGRGLGGTFDASRVFPELRSIAKKWGTLHFGILVYLLKGGIPLLAIYVGFLVPAMRVRSGSWYKNPCNLTAALLFPIYLLILCMNPVDFKPEALLDNLAFMLILSRFGRPNQLDSGRTNLQDRGNSVLVEAGPSEPARDGAIQSIGDRRVRPADGIRDPL